MAMIYAILNPPVQQPLVRLAVRVSVLFAMALLLHMSALSVLLSLRETDFMVSSELTSLAYASTPTSASAPAQGEAAVSHTMQQPRVCELPAQVSLAHVSRLVLFGKHPTEAGLAHTVSRFRDRIQRAPFLPRPDVASHVMEAVEAQERAARDAADAGPMGEGADDVEDESHHGALDHEQKADGGAATHLSSVPVPHGEDERDEAEDEERSRHLREAADAAQAAEREQELADQNGAAGPAAAGGDGGDSAGAGAGLDGQNQALREPGPAGKAGDSDSGDASANRNNMDMLSLADPEGLDAPKPNLELDDGPMTEEELAKDAGELDAANGADVRNLAREEDLAALEQDERARDALANDNAGNEDELPLRGDGGNGERKEFPRLENDPHLLNADEDVIDARFAQEERDEAAFLREGDLKDLSFLTAAEENEQKVDDAENGAQENIRIDGAEPASTMRLIVLTFNRALSLQRLLNSLGQADYGGDQSIVLEIFIDRDPSGHVNADVVQVAEEYPWVHGEKLVHVRERNVGLIVQWLESWHEKPNEHAMILEDDLEVSPHFYTWWVGAIHAYDADPRVAGYTLQRAAVRADQRHNTKPVHVPPEHKVFWYKLLGSWGFAPRYEVWKAFKEWYAETRTKDPAFRPYLPHLKMNEWFLKQKDKGTMWTMWFIRFCHDHHPPLFTVYANLPNRTTLGANYRESGLHYHDKAGAIQSKSVIHEQPDFGVFLDAKAHPEVFVFPRSPVMLDWNGSRTTG